MDKQDRLLAASLLAGSNMGLTLPSVGDLSHFFSHGGWNALRMQEVNHTVTQVWQSYIESDEIEDTFVEEARGWWDEVSKMNADELYRKYPKIYRLAGVGLYPAARALKRRNEFVEHLNSASYHFADDSGKEWGQASQHKIQAARIAIEDRWTGGQIMSVSSWARALVTPEDMVNLVLSEMYSAIDIVKEVTKNAV